MIFISQFKRKKKTEKHSYDIQYRIKEKSIVSYAFSLGILINSKHTILLNLYLEILYFCILYLFSYQKIALYSLHKHFTVLTPKLPNLLVSSYIQVHCITQALN